MVQAKTIVIIIIVIVVLIVLGVGGYFAYQAIKKWLEGFINIPDGGECLANDQCQSKVCGRRGTITDLHCCDKSKPPLMVAGFTYCTNEPKGTDCLYNAQCQSNYCSSTIGFSGKCQDTLPVGAQCPADQPTSCGKTACALNPNTTAGGSVCCPTDKTYTFYLPSGNAIKYCADLPDGSKCFSGEMCKSGKCTANSLSVTAGNCYSDNTPAGQECYNDSMCKSGACARNASDTDAPRVCCEHGTVYSACACRYFCKNVLDNGQPCIKNAQCKSGKCSSSSLGCSDSSVCGKCVPDTRTDRERELEDFMDEQHEKLLAATPNLTCATYKCK